MVVAFKTTKPDAGEPPNVTPVTPVKLVPVIVVDVPPTAEQLEPLIQKIVATTSSR